MSALASLTKRQKLMEFALGALWRRKGRNFAVVTVLVLVISLLFSVLFVVGSLKAEAARMLEDSPDIVVSRVWAGRQDLAPVAWAARLAGEPGVAEARPRYWGYYYDAFTKANYTVMESPGAGELRALSGRLPATPEECALGAGVAGARKVAVGDDVSFIDANAVGVTFTVTGIFSDDSRLLTNDLVVLSTEGVKAFFAFPEGMATDVALRVSNPAEVDALAKKAHRFFPDSRPITRKEMERTYDAVFDWRSGMLLVSLAGAVLALVVLAWDRATGLSAEEKREIGIQKALGWDTSDVLEMKFWEGFAVASISLLAGFLLSWAHVFYLDALVLGPILKGWSTLFPPLALTPSPDYLVVAEVAFLICAPYLAVTILPSWKAAKADPDEMIRG